MSKQIDWCRKCERFLKCNRIDRARGEKCIDYIRKKKDDLRGIS